MTELTIAGNNWPKLIDDIASKMSLLPISEIFTFGDIFDVWYGVSAPKYGYTYFICEDILYTTLSEGTWPLEIIFKDKHFGGVLAKIYSNYRVSLSSINLHELQDLLSNDY